MFDSIISTVNSNMPAFMQMSPVTMMGVGIAAFAALVYLFTHASEMLLVVMTAVVYAAVPALPHLG